MKLIALEIEQPLLTNEQYAEIIGCSNSTIAHWRISEVYQEELHKQLRKAFKNSVKIARKTMEDLARQGDYKASEYILNSAGYQAPLDINLTTNVIKVTLTDD